MKTLVAIFIFRLTMSVGRCWSDVTVSQNVRVRAYILTLKTYVLVFESVNHRVPAKEEGLSALVVNPDPAALPEWQKLVQQVPKDPWGHEYQYVLRPADTKTGYGIYSFGKDGVSHSNGNDPDDFNSWSESREPHSGSNRRALILISSGSATALALLLLWQAARRRQRSRS